jgi:four helix bundle protein
MYQDTSKLLAWQKSHEFALMIYKITQDFPKEELYGLTSQIRRAAVSVPSNIVEGRARGYGAETKRFYMIARASLEEARYQVLLARDLGYVNEDVYMQAISISDEAGRLLSGMIKRL